jgi:Bacterial Ig-like domain (group 3)/FlgD Ig-like domain
MRRRRGLRAFLVAMLVASSAAGSHVAAGSIAAADPTATTARWDMFPEWVVVDQNPFLRVIVDPVPDGGTVTLKIDGTTYDTQTMSLVGVNDFFWIPDTKGTYTLQAFFSGTANYAASQTPAMELPVTALPPDNVAFDASPNTVARNQDVVLTATVTPNPGAGSIEWRNNWYPYELLHTTPVDSNGGATWTTSFDTPGDHSVRAKWTGNDSYGPRYSGSDVVTVLPDDLALSVSVSGSPLPPGTITANVVMNPNPGSGELKWRTCDLGCAETTVAVDADGTTSINLGSHTVGDYSIWVRYPAQGPWEEASGSTQFSVWNTTSTTLATDRTTAYVGELPVKLTATAVLPALGQFDYAQGDITFLDDVGGVVLALGPVTVNQSTRQATFSSSTLRIGTHSIRAKYSGMDRQLGSTSAPVTVVVGADAAVHATFAPALAKFYPVKDGFKDIVKLGGVLSEKATVTIKAYNSAGTLKRTWSLGSKNPGAYSVAWNGKSSSGASLPAGTYTVKALFKDAKGHTRTISAKTAISLRQVAWKSVTVLRYAQSGTYYVSEFGGAIYYSPDYAKGRILDSGEMIRDCEDCGFAAGNFVFTVVSTNALAYRNLYLEFKGHDFTDREHPGSHALTDPRTGHLALINGNYPYDDPDVHWGIPFTSAFIDANHHVDAWIYMEQRWGDAYDLNWLRLTYQYAVWK